MGQLIKRDTNKIKNLALSDLFAIFISVLAFLSCTVLRSTTTLFTDISFVKTVSLPSFLFLLLVFFLALFLCVLLFHNKHIIGWALILSTQIFALTMVYKNPSNLYFNCGIALLEFFVANYVISSDCLSFSTKKIFLNIKWRDKLPIIIVSILCLLFTIIISYATILRYRSYNSSNFDFGIFAQMFEKMKHTGIPLTTVERNSEMSHFGVHFSPFFYLLFPFYALYSHPETLLVLQALAVSAGAFPIYFIAKELHFSTKCSLACSFIYLAFPSIAYGCFYDFHENKFLAVLLLWLVYFIIRNKNAGIIIFSFLVLSVKEDAAIYLFTLALFLMVYKKRYKKGIVLFIIAFLYFIFASAMVSHLGSGIMDTRFDNYWYDSKNGNLIQVMHTCLVNLGYLLSQLFTQDKFPFLLWLFVPLGFAPFYHKKKSLLILLIPILVINLMSNWKYQYDIKFQYTYGPISLLLVASFIAISSLSAHRKKFLLFYSMCTCLIFGFSLTMPCIENYRTITQEQWVKCDATTNALSHLPKDATITASTFLIPHLYQYDTVYQYPNYYAKSQDTDYIVVDKRYEYEEVYAFMEGRYTIWKTSGFAEIWKAN